MWDQRKCDGPCRDWKPESAFYTRRGIPSDICRSCQLADTAKRTKPSDKQRSRAKHLRKTYGLTPDQVVRMLERQEGKCAICRVEMTQPGSGGSSMVIDHDHATNKVRALLHDRCNRMLGNAQDQPEVLRAAARYVEEHAERERLRQEQWR